MATWILEMTFEPPTPTFSEHHVSEMQATLNSKSKVAKTSINLSKFFWRLLMLRWSSENELLLLQDIFSLASVEK